MTETVATQVKAIAFDRDIERLTEGFTGRDWVFEEIERWLQQDNERFFILTGEPGVGKSAITARLTQLRQDIAAYHFCIAGRSGTIEPNNVLLSLAAQLIDYFPDYAEALANTIKPLRLSVNVEITIETIKDSEVRGVVINNLHTQNPQEALNVVLRRSLAALPNPPQQPVLLLIDSLDEAVTLRGDNNLVTLLAETNDLPPWVRFVFTTRSERRVLRYFERLKPYTLVAESQMNLDDIRQYIENRVGKEKMQARLQLAEVEPETFVNRLSELSTGSFLYTKILLNDIEAGRQTLDDLSALPQSLDEIYHGFLKRFTVTEWEERYQPILGVLAVAQEPITEVQLAHFTGIGQGKIRQNLGVVRQFLDISDDGHGRETFSVFHQSLRDYLLNEERNIDFWCEAKEQHQRLVDYYMADDQPWHTKPTSDRYLWHHLAYHLSGASKNSELRALLFNFDWLQAKLNATNINALITDYGTLNDDKNLQIVKGAIQLSADILEQDKKQLAGQLLGRLMTYEIPDLQTLLEQVIQWREVPWLKPLTPSLTTPKGVLQRTIQKHTYGIRSVAVTADGRRAISASEDCTLKVWDLANANELVTLKGHTKSIWSVAVTADGRRAISASEDCTLKVWDLASQSPLFTLKGHTTGVRGVAITADGQKAISASGDCSLKVWDLVKGKELTSLKGHTKGVWSVAITADGQKAISASEDCTVKVWDLASQQELFTLKGHQSPVRAVAITTDSQRLVSASEDCLLKVWDLTNGRQLTSLKGHTKGVWSVAITADGQKVISASKDRSLKVWDLCQGHYLGTLLGHSAWVWSVATAVDGQTVVSASEDRTLKVWDLTRLHELEAPPDHAGAVTTVAITLDGKRIVSASEDHTLKVWDLDTRKVLHTLRGHRNWVRAVAITGDSSRIISASDDCTLKTWDLAKGQELNHFANYSKSGIRALAMTLDGEQIIFADRGTLKLLDLKHNRLLRSLPGYGNFIGAVAITNQGDKAVSTSKNGTLIVWDLLQGKQVKTLRGHKDWVMAITITADGKHAISASRDWTIKIWDLASGQEVKTLSGHMGWVVDVAVSMDGQRLVSACIDGTLKIWNLRTQKVIASFKGDSRLYTCAIAADGVTVAAGDGLGRVHFLRMEGI